MKNLEPHPFDTKEERERARTRMAELGPGAVRGLHACGGLPQHWERFTIEWLAEQDKKAEADGHS